MPPSILSTVNLDQILNLVYFIVGLGIGLLQLYIGQRQFESQQRDRMSEIQKSIADIEKRIAVLQEVSSQRAFDMQDKLLKVAINQRVVDEINVETAESVREIVTQELKKAGVEDAIQRAATLENKVTRILEKSTASLVGFLDDKLNTLTSRELAIIELLQKDLNVKEIASNLGIVEAAVRYHLSNIYKKLGVKSRSELLDMLRQRAVSGEG